MDKLLQNLPISTQILQNLPNSKKILQNYRMDGKHWGGGDRTLHPQVSLSSL